jgi:hypothetical protein
MTPLRRRFIEDIQLHGLGATTQRSYIHYVADFAKFYRTSPEHLDLEAIRQYELYLLLSWRRGSGSNRRIKVLQTFALPLGYRAWGLGSSCKIPRIRAPSQSRLLSGITKSSTREARSRPW